MESSHFAHCFSGHTWSTVSRSVLCNLKKIQTKESLKEQDRDDQMIKGIENLTYEERLRELGLLALEKNGLVGTLFQYLNGGNKEDGDFLLIRR